jgi:hypothetical protein
LVKVVRRWSGVASTISKMVSFGGIVSQVAGDRMMMDALRKVAYVV